MVALNPRAELARGADVSWITQMEAAGRVVRNASGVPGDQLDILKDYGINSVRLRVWVDPDSGWCNKADLLVKALRAKEKGLRIMINFHYSDTWVDPGVQGKPAAWSGHDLATLVTDVAAHTTDVLSTLKDSGVTPEWVQVGNETNDGLLWPEGRATLDMAGFASLVQGGAKAAKAVFPSTKVVVHLSNAHDNVMYRWIFDGLKAGGVDWDVIGMSHYPDSTTWRATTAQAYANMQDMVSRYGKDVVISETGMDWRAADSCYAMLKQLQLDVASLSGGHGLGVFYWEPAAYWGFHGYQMGAFDDSGKPTRALEAFGQAKPVSIVPLRQRVGVETEELHDASGRRAGSARRWHSGWKGTFPIR